MEQHGKKEIMEQHGKVDMVDQHGKVDIVEQSENITQQHVINIPQKRGKSGHSVAAWRK